MCDRGGMVCLAMERRLGVTDNWSSHGSAVSLLVLRNGAQMQGVSPFRETMLLFMVFLEAGLP